MCNYILDIDKNKIIHKIKITLTNSNIELFGKQRCDSLRGLNGSIRVYLRPSKS